MNKATAVDRDALLPTRRELHQPVASATELGTWAECVRMLLGPRMVGEGIECQRLNALRLAAAALEFAGADDLAVKARSA